MASTYSPLKIELIGTGEQAGTWGTTTNLNLGTALEEAITGSADVSFSSSDVTLTLTDTNAAQTGRNLRLNLTGTSGGARNLILGADMQIEKLYLINNGLADEVTVKNTTGTGIAVPAGKSMFVFNNGTNVVDAVTHLTSLTLGSALPVASGGTGITSFGSGVATWLGTPSSSNLAAAMTDETGSGSLVFATSPTLTTPNIGAATGTQLNLTAQGDLRFEDASGGQYAAIQAPATIASNYTLTLPTTDGDANQVLTTDGSGVLTWTTPSTGISTGKAIAMAIVFGG